jgi:hypothetical protein
MPLVIVPSWWAPESVYWAGITVPLGSSHLVMDMGTITVPTQPGDYYITIAYHPESGGPSFLASGTYSRYGTPVWNDDNDLYNLTPAQRAAADATGRMQMDYLIASNEYIQAEVPCAIVHIQVIDLTAPVTSAIAYGTLGDNGWYTSSVSVLLEAADAGTGVSQTFFSVDSAPAVLYTAPVGIFAEGTHTLRYWSVDLSGNVEGAHTLQVRIDATLPTASITVQGTASQGRGGYDLGQPNIILSATDAVSGPAAIYYRYDGGAWLTYNGQFRFALLTSATLDVMAVDEAGNEGAIISRLVKVDAVAPAVTPAFTGNHGLGQWFNSAVLVTLNVNEQGSGVDSVWYSFDGDVFQNYTAPFWVNLTGTYHLWARASDQAGNIGAVSSSLLLVDRDLPAPAAAINGSQGLDIWWLGALTVQLSAQDVGSGVDSILYSLDGANWAIYGSPFAITGQGVHTLSLKASDAAGNQALQIDRSIGIDTGIPDCNFTFAAAAASSGWFLSSPVPVVEIDDRVSGPGKVYFLLDGAPINWSTGTPIAVQGTHMLRLRVADAAGNLGPWQEMQIKVDTIAPVTSVGLSGPAGLGGWYVGDVNALLSVIENESGVAVMEYRWDGGTWTVTTGSILCNGEGKRLLEFRARDLAGNVEATEGRQVWVDKTAPAVQLATPSRAHFTTSGGEVRWSGVDAASGIAYVQLSVDGGAFLDQGGDSGVANLTGLADGTHIVVLRLVDNAGNTLDLASTVTVDTNPLSPGGPYGVLPLLIILGVVAVAAGAFIFMRRRR